MSTSTVKVSSLTEGSYVLISNRPCKITRISSMFSYLGAQSRIEGADIFTGRKLEGVFVAGANIEVPRVEREDVVVVRAEDGKAIVKDVGGDGQGEERLVSVHPGLERDGRKVEGGGRVRVVRSGGEAAVVEILE